MQRKVPIAILISGRGSNLKSLVAASRQANDYPAQVAVVVSDSPNAGGLVWAEQQGIATVVIDRSAYHSRLKFDCAITSALCEFSTEIICCAGFMRVLGEQFVARWQGRILNIHPSLLPEYPGLNTHARVLADGRSVTGCTVHLVTKELDAGPILGQTKVEVLPDDTEDTLAARVLIAEHKLYPNVCASFVQDFQRRAHSSRTHRS